MLPFVPMLIGAALGGGISAARGGNFLTGALLGGLGGALGGATGLLGGASGATTGAATAAGTGGGFLGGGYGSLGLAGQTALQGAGSAVGGAGSGMFSNTISGIGKDFTAVTDWAKANPIDALRGAQLAKDTLYPEQQPMLQSAGLMRGQQMQQQAPAYAMARPQISLI